MNQNKLNTITIESIALVDAKARRGVTAKVNDNDREVAAAIYYHVMLPALEAVEGRLTTECNLLREHLAEMVPRDWHGLMSILDTHYREDAFPTLPDDEARDLGPRIVSLLRQVDKLTDQVQRVRDWSTDSRLLRVLDGEEPE